MRGTRGSGDRRGRPVSVPRWLIDTVLVLPPPALGLLSALVRPGNQPVAMRALSAVLVVLMAASLLLRRRLPVPVFALVALCLATQWSLSIPAAPGDLVLFAALYAVAAYGTGRWPVGALGVSLLGVLMAWWGVPTGPPVRPVLGLVAPTVAVVATWLIGRNARIRRLYLDELEERARRLEREQDAQARAAVAEERARIAREMHDVVAHRVGVMVAQADGATYAFDAQPDQARAALSVIAGNGRAALAELRHLLNLLRAATAEVRPQPGVGDIDELVTQMQAAGLPVRYLTRGQRPDDRGDQVAEEAEELAAYRIVQEALTNVLKHAGPGTPTTVRVVRGGGGFQVEVVDDGPVESHPARPGSDLPHGGHGLIGMRERALSLGGAFAAGPRKERGWVVRATWPAESEAL